MIIIQSRELISMKRLHKSDAINENQPKSKSTLHGCPFCICGSAGHSPNVSCSSSQPQIYFKRAKQPNVYLTNGECNEDQSYNKTSKPRLTSILNIPSNRIIFKSPNGVSLKQTNISFSYTSPPRSKKHFSSESRFNTKKYKESRFPQISNSEIDDIPVKRVIKQGKPNNPFVVYATQKTPEKPRILKLKSQKSQDKVAMITVKNHSQNFRLKNEQIVSIQHMLSRQYESGEPSSTPINALCKNESQPSQKQGINEETYTQTHHVDPPISIQLISQKEGLHSNRDAQIKLQPQPTFQQVVRKPIPTIQSNKKYPAIESLEIYQTPKVPEHRMQANNQSSSSRGDETSLRFVKQQSQPDFYGHLQKSFEMQIAQSIVQELNLHFDYYYLMSQSDRSLSLHVDL